MSETPPAFHSESRGAERGFVLIAAIWFVAILAFVAVIISGWMTRSLGRASTMQERIIARAAEVSAINRVAYLMTSSYFSARGLEVLSGRALADAGELLLGAVEPVAGASYIAVDDRPYRYGDVVVRLQDDRGLFNLNYSDRAALGNLLRVYGIPYADRDGLTDKLFDYIDRNEFTSRLNGAAREEYVRTGRPAPREGPLLTPWEIYRVLGWDQYKSLWTVAAPLPAVTTVSSMTNLNPNTAPEAIVRTIPGLDTDAVTRLLQYRTKYLILNQEDLQRATGRILPFILGQFSFFPGPDLHLTLTSAHDPENHILALRLTPMGSAPYRIDYAVEQPHSDGDRTLLTRKDLPDLPTVADTP